MFVVRNRRIFWTPLLQDRFFLCYIMITVKVSLRKLYASTIDSFFLCLLNQIPKQQEVLTLAGTHIKQNSRVLNKTDTPALNFKALKLVSQFTYLDGNISSTETDFIIHTGKAYSVIDRLSITWKSDLSDKTKGDLFQAVTVSVLSYGCTIWTLRNPLGKKT